MSLSKSVLRLSSLFLDHESPDCIDRQERLFSCIMLVSIFYVILSIAFFKMKEIEARRPHIFHPDPSVCFELAIAPPEPKSEALMRPPAIGLTRGSEATGGGKSGQAHAENPSLPALITNAPPAEITHSKPVSHTTTMPAPVNIVSTNEIAAPPLLPPPAQPAPETPASADHNGGLPNAPSDGSSPNPGPGITGSGTGPGSSNGVGPEQNGGGQLAIAKHIPMTRAFFNISPYRKALLLKLATNVSSSLKKQTAIVDLTIAKDGTLLDAELYAASSNKAGRQALEAVRSLTYDPLPDEFAGDNLVFRITLDSTGAR
jgi:hypothetical protein